jgi:hypothetical protein
MLVETDELLSIQNFAAQYRPEGRDKPYKRGVIYAFIKAGQIPKESVVKIDGKMFIKKEALNEKP